MKNILILLLFFSSYPLFSQKLEIVADEWPPYQIVESDGEISGFSTEIVRSVLDMMKLKSSISIRPYARVHYYLKNGISDAGFLVTKNKGREKYLWYPSEPVHVLKHVFFVSHDKNITATKDSYDFLKGYRIGLTKEYVYPADFIHFIQQNNIMHEYVTNDAQNFKKLHSGRLDIVVADISNGLSIIRKNSFEKEIVPVENYILAEYNLYFVWSKKRKEKIWADIFSEKLELFKETDRYNELLEKYFN